MRTQMSDAQMQEEIRKAKRFNDIAFIVTMVLTAASLVLIITAHAYFSFTPRRWKSAPNARKYMVYSLLKKNKLCGMQKNEIYNLLGYDQHKWNSQANTLTYYLGASRNHTGEMWLVCQLENDTVKSYRITRE